MNPETGSLFEPQTIAQIVSIVGAIFLIVQRGVKLFEKPRRRQRLLEDLDIFDKAPKTSPLRAHLESHIEKEMKELYDPSLQRAKPRVNWGSVVILGFMFLGLAYWAVHLSRDGFSGWSILPGLFAVGTIGVLIEELTGRPTTTITKEPRLSTSSGVTSDKTPGNER